MISFHPHSYQKKGYWSIVDADPVKTKTGKMVKACALFLDPGLGKTSTTLMAIKALIRAKQVKGVLVVAPRRVMMSVWNPDNPDSDMSKFKQFNKFRVKVLKAPQENRLERLAEDADIYVVNPEGLPLIRDAILSGEIRCPFDMLVVDESTKFKKKPKAPAKSKAMLDKRPYVSLWQMLPLFHTRVILTGTPDPNGLMDLFGQIFLLDEGRTLGEHITHFRNQFFWTPHPKSFKWFPRDGASESVMNLIAPFTLRMKAEDYLQMPEIVFKDVQVVIEGTCAKAYAQMERDFLVEIEGKEEVALNEGAKLSKLHQIANGGLYKSDDPFTKELMKRTSKRDTHRLHTYKNDALEELIEEIGGSPVLVMYFFQHDLDRLKAQFGDDVPNIGSGVSDEKIAKYEKEWNAGNISVLLLNPASAAHGLNLQRSGHHVVWYSMTWDYELYEQAYRRVWRQGQQKPVFVYHLVAYYQWFNKGEWELRPTVDVVIRKALQSKATSSAERMKMIQDYRKEKLRIKD